MKYLYRLRGGEILGVSTDVAAWNTINTKYFGTLTSPPTPDGTDLSPQKIWDGTAVRNATIAEISAFAAAATTDENLQERDEVVLYLKSGERGPMPKALRLFMRILLDEINTLRSVANLPAITLADLKLKMRNKLNSGAAD